MKKFRFNSLNNLGVSLIEVMVSLSILIFLAFALLGIYFQFGKIFSLGQTSNVVTGATRQGLNEIVFDAVQAVRVSPSYVYNGQNYTSGSSTLVLELPAIDLNGNTITNAFDKVIYYTTSSLLYRIVAPGNSSARSPSSRIVANAISALNFNFNSNIIASTTALTAQITAVERNGRVTSTSTVSDTFALRNYSP